MIVSAVLRRLRVHVHAADGITHSCRRAGLGIVVVAVTMWTTPVIFTIAIGRRANFALTVIIRHRDLHDFLKGKPCAFPSWEGQ